MRECVYRGYPGGAVEYVTRGRTRPLAARLDIMNASPTGFSWGYGGSGPSQLALAILSHHFGRGRAADGRALDLHQAFKWGVIAKLDYGQAWQLTSAQVQEAMEEIGREDVALQGQEGVT